MVHTIKQSVVFVDHIETNPHNNELNKIKKPQQLFIFQQKRGMFKKKNR